MFLFVTWHAANALAAESFPDALSGDWGGVRTQLVGAGLRPELTYTGEVLRNRGGVRDGDARLGLFELKVTADGQTLLGVPGLTAFVHVLRTHGDDPAALTGDAQGISNIAAPMRTRLFGAWVQQNFLAQRTSVLAGRFDLNAEFYRLDAADLFLNSSFGIGPEFAQTGRGGPSLFPESALGVRVESRAEPLLVRVAVLNGVPTQVARADGSTGLYRPGDGSLLVGEAVLLWPVVVASDDPTRNRRRRLGRAAVGIERDTKIAAGGWHYTATFDDLARRAADGSPLRQQGSSGGYLIGEQVVYRDPARPGRRARVFAQLGVGDARVARFSSYTGVGFAFVGAFPSRAEDELGLALGVARNSAGYREQQRAAGGAPSSAETALELTYLMALRPWLSAQASLQRVRNPNTDPALKNATVAQLRFEISF